MGFSYLFDPLGTVCVCVKIHVGRTIGRAAK
jgi:hypothetical protein